MMGAEELIVGVAPKVVMVLMEDTRARAEEKIGREAKYAKYLLMQLPWIEGIHLDRVLWSSTSVRPITICDYLRFLFFSSYIL